MSSTAEFDPATEVLLEDTRARRTARLGGRALWASVADGGVFLVVAAALLLLYDSTATASPLLVLALVGAYALAYNVDFEVGPGLAVATQLVFVPMLFLLPLQLVPLCVAAGVMLGNVLELAEGRIRLERVLGRFGEATYSLGPVLVLAAAGVSAPADAAPWVLLVALAAQFAFDFVHAATHARIALGISEALTCTLFGLGIAVPALVGFVYFSKKVEVMSVEMESLVTDLLSKLYFGRIVCETPVPKPPVKTAPRQPITQ